MSEITLASPGRRAVQDVTMAPVGLASEPAQGPVLVTGANGFVGRTVSTTLASMGMQVMCGQRFAMSPSLGGQPWVAYGDIGPDTNWDRALNGIGQIVHLAGVAHASDASSSAFESLVERVNVQGTERLARAAAMRGVRRFVFVSSALVHGTTSSERPICETDRLRPEGAYARSKANAEHRLREVAKTTGMELVILRPPMVYGAGARGNFRRLVNLVRLGVPLPLGRATAPRSFIGVENLADAIACCVKHSAAAGETFLVADAETSSTADIIDKIAVILGQPVLTLRTPPGLLHKLARLLGREKDYSRLFEPFVLDAASVEEKLGWKPPVTLLQGIRSAICTQST